MLEEQQDELRAMFSKLEADRDMELEERQKLEEEIRMKQDEIEQVRNVVEEKDEETRRLQDEMSDAKRQLEVQSITSSCGKTFLCDSVKSGGFETFCFPLGLEYLKNTKIYFNDFATIRCFERWCDFVNGVIYYKLGYN